MPRKYSSLRTPDERVGRPRASSGPLSSRKPYAASWLCVVQLQPTGGCALTQDVPPRGCGVPVGLEVAAGGIAAGADVLLAERLRGVHVRVERGQRGVGDRSRDVPVASDGGQPIVVEDRADLGRRDLAPEDLRALVVAGELDAVVADLRQPREDLLEAVRDAGGVRRGADPVAHREQDDAALAGRHQPAAAAPSGAREAGAERDGAGSRPERSAEEPAPVQRVRVVRGHAPPLAPKGLVMARRDYTPTNVQKLGQGWKNLPTSVGRAADCP
ncbi:MAG TPA: hypothetical protein VFP78_12605 [Solirubrobacteraceae bacterium]|nr:hypothetical protein [Solirubrobacteraceae bacterium]